ncbi:flavin reductase family protein [Raineya orbicola]|jgi:flavin reductase (DIM6/NTAB) family NADH-FMN oxidoreductase RutF|uniref:Flavin reductase like domain n=1 Tax=Raineya orbicola TaxID=2016530 RepID=A0A2N3IH49_9BACT|nr:flavin reductase [Raineya orbicola]PKQ69636.1 Flavin reductase like domain [Raineya orbicola]
MAHFTKESLLTLETLYRRNLMNTLLGFKNANLIGTRDKKGNENLAIFNSLVHLGANPPHIAFVMRPTTVERHTYDNIHETGFYTFNHVHTSFVEKAHQTSAKYPKEVSEFETCGLTPIYRNHFPAPFVAESSIQIGMKFVEAVFIPTNEVYLIIGEVQEFFVPDDCLRSDGFIDLQKAGTAVVSGLDAYYEAQAIARFSYARPQQELKKI